MARIGRRTFLKLTGASAIATRTGGMAAVLASRQAPAYAQAGSVHWLRWNDFVPASDEMLRKEIVPAGEKALGVKITLETINGNDIQARTTAAIQSGQDRTCLGSQLVAAAALKRCRRRYWKKLSKAQESLQGPRPSRMTARNGFRSLVRLGAQISS
jgi:hypothetical protein